MGNEEKSKEDKCLEVLVGLMMIVVPIIVVVLLVVNSPTVYVFMKEGVPKVLGIAETEELKGITD